MKLIKVNCDIGDQHYIRLTSAQGTNTLAYLALSSATKEKSFITLAPGLFFKTAFNPVVFLEVPLGLS